MLLGASEDKVTVWTLTMLGKETHAVCDKQGLDHTINVADGAVVVHVHSHCEGDQHAGPDACVCGGGNRHAG